MNKFFILLLALAPQLFSQVFAPAVARRPLPAAAVEFTSTSNASQAGVNLVLGYQFTVRTPVVLTSLGAILQGSSNNSPVFGVLPASMPVGLWDQDRNLLVSATILASDPAMGHFNYAQVAETLLAPGISYTIAGLVRPGSSVLSDVPDLTPGSEIVFAGPRSFASDTLAFPETDAIGLRKSYFGASFTYTGSRGPVALPGRDRNVTAGDVLKLDSSASFSFTGTLTSKWTLISKPAGSTATLAGANTATPWFTADLPGIYVAQLICNDGSADSVPSTVSIQAAPPAAELRPR
jgi:hypothetical protein